MLMLNRFVPGLTCVTWLAATTAMAQPAPAPAPVVAPLTVQGAAPPKMIEKQAYSFVQSYAAVSNPEIDQIGRWQGPVCVQVVGLDRAEQAATIKARIESVAQEVGLPAARAGCSANVEIVFTDQPQRTMDIVAKSREALLGYYHYHDRDRLKAVTGPIQSWYKTATRSWGGCAVSLAFADLTDASGRAVRNTGFPGTTTGNETVDDPESVPPVGCGDASRFTATYTSLFDNVFIVADSKALEGEDIGVVADYMVMLALSKPRTLDGCNALPSVTDLYAKSACPGRDPPDGLTAADAAYLTALYKADPEARKAFQQSDIAGRMTKILVSGSAGGR